MGMGGKNKRDLESHLGDELVAHALILPGVALDTGEAEAGKGREIHAGALGVGTGSQTQRGGFGCGEVALDSSTGCLPKENQPGNTRKTRLRRARIGAQ